MDKKEKKVKKVDKNVQKVIGLEKKVAELENDWKRALADYKNLQKRVSEERSTITQLANIVLIENLLPVLDNFLLLEEHSSDVALNMSIKEFVQVLENAGLKEIDIKPGDTFDPKKMDAIEKTEGETNKVMEMVRKGYYFKDKLIRPVSVKVGGGKKNHSQEGRTK